MQKIKKDLFFVVPMIIINVLLIMLKVTGIVPHIIISVVGVAVLVAYAVMTIKEWLIPALEIVMRVLYGIALVTGIIIMNVHGVAVLGVIHKISAVLSFASLVALFIHKIVKNK